MSEQCAAAVCRRCGWTAISATRRAAGRGTFHFDCPRCIKKEKQCSPPADPK